ncbi:hypothetical protein [Acinetobacter dispersus]|uniref:Uncharacterized protein n=1 Tax=Acinetobacter dispersus TaxID=70348 RepID=N9LEG0_9GAMM|nr:hypothetical protein [Acinetobacter dispersus]ENW94682.1 hypothetical protein F904_00648 [Acinetobacter dispersus]
MKICFQCKVCGSQECRNGDKEINGFDIIGYEVCVEWSESLNSIPEKNENGWWMRLDKMPSLSENRVIHVQQPFNEDIGALFWTLYAPALSSLNGYEEYMEEIESSAFVKCKIESVLFSNDIEAWLKVSINEVKPLTEFSNLLPQRQEEISIWSLIYDLENDYIARYKDWIYYSGQAQGDLGNWLIIKMIEQKPYLVALGEWTFHQDAAYMCNMLLSDKSYARVLQAEEI